MDDENKQLDRIETKINYLYDLGMKQAEKNGLYDAHLDNHKKANKLIGYVVGVAVSLTTLIKSIGG